MSLRAAGDVNGLAKRENRGRWKEPGGSGDCEPLVIGRTEFLVLLIDRTLDLRSTILTINSIVNCEFRVEQFDFTPVERMKMPAVIHAILFRALFYRRSDRLDWKPCGKSFSGDLGSP
jgi:hypothetical protein